MKLAPVFIIALAAAAVGCSTVQVNANYDPATDFSKYKTFTMQKGSPAKDSIAARQIETALANALQARGFTRVESGGDLNLYPHFYLGKETQLNTYGYGGWRMGGMQTTQVQEIPTGTLVVDLVEAKANNLVWRGTAKDEISTTATPEDRQKKATDVATQLFANFPPARK